VSSSPWSALRGYRALVPVPALRRDAAAGPASRAPWRSSPACSSWTSRSPRWTRRHATCSSLRCSGSLDQRPAATHLRHALDRRGRADGRSHRHPHRHPSIVHDVSTSGYRGPEGGRPSTATGSGSSATTCGPVVMNGQDPRQAGGGTATRSTGTVKGRQSDMRRLRFAVRATALAGAAAISASCIAGLRQLGRREGSRPPPCPPSRLARRESRRSSPACFPYIAQREGLYRNTGQRGHQELQHGNGCHSRRRGRPDRRGDHAASPAHAARGEGGPAWSPSGPGGPRLDSRVHRTRRQHCAQLKGQGITVDAVGGIRYTALASMVKSCGLTNSRDVNPLPSRQQRAAGDDRRPGEGSRPAPQ